jgi:hypothetical protein
MANEKTSQFRRLFDAGIFCVYTAKTGGKHGNNTVSQIVWRYRKSC